MSDDRLINIETMLAHQDQQIQDLSDMLNVQRAEIDTLKRLLQKAQDKIADIEGAQGDKEPALSVAEQALRDKPPHY